MNLKKILSVLAVFLFSECVQYTVPGERMVHGRVVKVKKQEKQKKFFIVYPGYKREEPGVCVNKIVLTKKLGRLISSYPTLPDAIFYVGKDLNQKKVGVFKAGAGAGLEKSVESWYRLYYSDKLNCEPCQIRVSPELLRSEVEEIYKYRKNRQFSIGCIDQIKAGSWFYFYPDCKSQECVRDP